MNALTPRNGGVSVPTQPKAPPSPELLHFGWWLWISLVAPASTFTHLAGGFVG